MIYYLKEPLENTFCTEVSTFYSNIDSKQIYISIGDAFSLGYSVLTSHTVTIKIDLNNNHSYNFIIVLNLINNN